MKNNRLNAQTPKEAVEIALHGGFSGSVPFTIYEAKIPQCASERDLRNRGLCIVNRRIPVYKTISPNVKVTEFSYWEDGKKLCRTSYETPLGTVSTLSEPAGFTTWTHEKMFKSPEDYKILKFIANDQQFRPCYQNLTTAEQNAGGDIIFRSSLGLEPLQCFISGNMMGMQDFCYEWIDHRDEILAIASIIREKHHHIARLIADSPVGHANYGGNVVPEIIGKETFEQYYVPCYNEAADILHRKGKLLGCHFDANCRLLAQSIAESQLDYIEAFTPAPDTDLSLAEARAIWKNKVLWLNFPSSWHLCPDQEVRQKTHQLLGELQDFSGLIMGITEDIPPERHLNSCNAIMTGLEQFPYPH